jgi:hypothetical protein
MKAILIVVILAFLGKPLLCLIGLDEIVQEVVNFLLCTESLVSSRGVLLGHRRSARR